MRNQPLAASYASSLSSSPGRGAPIAEVARSGEVKIATYNVNGVNGRLPVLLRWLEQAQPDVVALQELKAPDERFPEVALRERGYDAIWHGQKSWNGVAILSRVGTIHETRRCLPDDPDPAQSRYIEAAINGVVVAGLYLPNGNPRPGPKFDYKLAWFDRLIDHAGHTDRLEDDERPGAVDPSPRVDGALDSRIDHFVSAEPCREITPLRREVGPDDRTDPAHPELCDDRQAHRTETDDECGIAALNAAPGHGVHPDGQRLGQRRQPR